MKSNLFTIIYLASLMLISCGDKSNGEPKTNSEENKEEMETMAQLEYEIKAQLGEGAFWNHRSQELFWVDIEGQQLHIYDPASKSNRSLPTPSKIGTVVPQTDSTAVVALVDGIYIMNTNNGELEVLSEVEKEMTYNRFNDGKCDPNGNLWVGSMHYDQNQPLASVYKIAPWGNTTKMIDSVTISNGLVWTKDASIFYYIDTPTGTIQAYDFNRARATISNKRTAVAIPDSLGFPDGMAIDAEDKLWVGLWNGSAIGRFDPVSGELISKIEVPAQNVTACAFGGPNLDKLYITTASIGMTDAQKNQYPLAGSLFVANPGVKGVKSDFFKTEQEVLDSLIE